MNDVDARSGAPEEHSGPPPATPVRALGAPDPAGYRLLRDVSSTYRDGGEEAILALIDAVGDRGCDSIEMLLRAKGWAQRYHVDPARANILRCLELPPSARVLEIGAGCGAITRYLGEHCALVDALEPVPIRAAAAAARTRDLAGVTVFVGELGDVPAETAYDVIIVIGVLEYAAGGSADSLPYLDFLNGIRSRLAPGGTLVLAIENRLGVKYLAGAPEDHTDRIFDSVEGYPRGGHARTFNRRELESLIRGAHLNPVTYIAFPDYKLTRAVFGDLPEQARSLLHRVPHFPSPDWRSQRPRLADERSLWREFVGAGLEADFGNSFLVLASHVGRSALWPEDRAGVFFATNRVPALTTQTLIETGERPGGTQVHLRRTVRRPSPPDRGAHQAPDAPDRGAEPGSIHIIEGVTDFQPGRDLTAVLAADGVEAWHRYASEWLGLLDAALASDAAGAIDLVPHNLVVDADDHLRVIDVELAYGRADYDHVVRRGIFWLADRAAPLAPPERWAPAMTVGDLMRVLGVPAGLDADGRWIDAAIAQEVDFLARVWPGPPAGSTVDQWRAGIEAGLRRRVAKSLATTPLGDRLPTRNARIEKALATARAATATARAAASAARAAAVAAEARASKAADLAAAAGISPRSGAEHRRLGRPALARATRAGRRVAARLVPRGSRRRRAVAALLPPGSRRRRLLDRLRER